MRKKLLPTTILALGLLASAPALADYESGVDAYERQDYATAYAELRPLAEQGSAAAQDYLGDMYYYGRGVVQDYAESVRWYRAAAEQGDALTQYKLGYAYNRGEGVAKDDAEAARWYRAAADQGYRWSQYYLAVLYLDGTGVAQDYAEAFRLFSAAASQGHGDAMTTLGYMHARGLGVPQDDAEAIRWYRAGAEAGSATGQYNLGERYENGRGVPQDLAEAKRWYQAAADQGDADSQAALHRLAQLPSGDNAFPGANSATTKSCNQIVGEWNWFVGGIVGATPEGDLSWRQSASAMPVPAGRWRCEGGTYTLAWSNGFVDTLQLSADGGTLSGTNQQGTPVSGARALR